MVETPESQSMVLLNRWWRSPNFYEVSQTPEPEVDWELKKYGRDNIGQNKNKAYNQIENGFEISSILWSKYN